MKNLNCYKITNRNTKNVIYLTPEETTNFIKKVQTWKYIFVTPKQRRATRLNKRLDILAFLCFASAFIILITHLMYNFIK